MPSDIPFVAASVPQTTAPKRLPLGVGLTIGAFTSVALWGAIGLGLRALFF
jgi:hypothetical protein